MKQLVSPLSLVCLALALVSVAARPTLDTPIDPSFRANAKACLACHVAVDAAHWLWNTELSGELLAKLVSIICTSVHIEERAVCSDIVGQMKDQFVYIIGQTVANPRQICGLVFDHCGKPFDPIFNNWTVRIDVHKPPIKPWPIPHEKSTTVRVLQLSDMHFDPDYLEGAVVNCNEPLCCRDTSTAENTSYITRAGKFASFGACDIPLSTVQAMFKHISATEEFDYVMWSGDLAPHDVWSYSRRRTNAMLDVLSGLMRKYFGRKFVYGAVGNHEGVPTDSFPTREIPARFSNAWLYEGLADQWRGWMNTDQQREHIVDRASYVVQVLPRLRLISLNTQYGYATNFWVYLNSTDPDGTLQWLSDELLSAERAGDKVHIVGHAPPGRDDMLLQWSNNYNDIVNRFEATVTAQFFGHTHYDQFSVAYDGQSSDDRPYSMYFVSPSMTTYPRVSPAYRIYSVDGGERGTHRHATWTVVDHITNSVNISASNLKGQLVWQEPYSPRSTYNMSSFSPLAWHELTKRFSTNIPLLNKYIMNYYRLSSAPPCDVACREQFVCSMRCSRSHSQHLLCPP